MSEPTLTQAETADFRCLTGMIVPPSAKYAAPGADDATIFADIVASLGRDADLVRSALARLRALAGGSFAALEIPVATGGACSAIRARNSSSNILARVISESFIPTSAPTSSRARTLATDKL